MRLTAGLIGIALLISLFVQTMASPIAGAWLFFLLVGCCTAYKPPVEKTALWWAAVAWLYTIGASTFLIAPVVNGAATMWILAAAPMVALSLPKEYLVACFDVILAILIIFACGLIFQRFAHVQFTQYNYINAYAWPLVDPNNAACVVNCGLIPCFWMALKRHRHKWFIPTGIFALALFSTLSKAGAAAAVISCAILVYEEFGSLPLWIISLPAVYMADLFYPHFRAAFQLRIPIWAASAKLLKINPLTGLGWGSFVAYYPQVRTEDYTGGYFAHNDLLQFAIEAGIPAALVFCFLVFTAARAACGRNLVSGCVLLAIFLQAMIEFQFYVPAVSILAGVALAYHMAYTAPHGHTPKL